MNTRHNSLRPSRIRRTIGQRNTCLRKVCMNYGLWRRELRLGIVSEPQVQWIPLVRGGVIFRSTDYSLFGALRTVSIRDQGRHLLRHVARPTQPYMYSQSFMQDNIFASHTFFGLTHKHFQGITDNIYNCGRHFLLLHFLFVRRYFYPSKTGFTCSNDGWTGFRRSLTWT